VRSYHGSSHGTWRRTRLRSVLVLAVPVAIALVSGCEEKPEPLAVPGGEAARGKALMAQYQCGACHAIPGVAAARGTAGPPLTSFGQRSYIAGHIPNQPQNLVRWLLDPPAMVPGTTMPSLGLSDEEARHMAAYLYSLE
jgi:cytochrome c